MGVKSETLRSWNANRSGTVMLPSHKGALRKYVIWCIIIDFAGLSSALEKWSDHGMLQVCPECQRPERGKHERLRICVKFRKHFRGNSLNFSQFKQTVVQV